MSKLDQYYRRLVMLKFFKGGWGSSQSLAKIVDYRRNWVGKRDTCLQLFSQEEPVQIDKEYKLKDHDIIEGSFLTPFVHIVPDLIPEAVRRAKFQFLIPKKWNTSQKPVVFHFAGTGDQNFWRRRLILAKPLLAQHSVAQLIIENPFYGCRKPKEQERTHLVHVKDLFVMGACLITECLVLLKWCEKNGFGPFVLTGLSMGGHMACLAATVWPKALALVPCLSWTTASPTFTRGVMSSAIAWKTLEQQFYSDKNYKELKERLKALHELENQRRHPHNKHISTFAAESDIDYGQLINFNRNEPKEPINREILEFMHLLMDECTHLLNFDVPFDTSMVHAVAARDDAYVLRDGVNDFGSIWPGSQVEYLDQGHVSAFLLSQQKFRETIVSMLNKLIEKHYPAN